MHNVHRLHTLHMDVNVTATAPNTWTATGADYATWTMTRTPEGFTVTDDTYWTITLDDIGNVEDATPIRETNYVLGSFHAEEFAQAMVEAVLD